MYYCVTCYRLPGCWLALCAVCLVGCSEDDVIRKYTLPKSAARAISQEETILGAIVPKSQNAWFFKLKGEPVKVDSYKKDFRDLVNSLSFADDGNPKWKLPEKWREEGGGQFAYANLLPPDAQAPKVSVSPLQIDPSQLEEASWRQYVVENVNRWRGQLNLPKQSWDEMAAGLEPIESLSAPKAPAYFVSLRGRASSKVSGVMGTQGGPSAIAGDTPTKTLPSGPPNIQFKLPNEQWRELSEPLNMLAIKSFEADGPNGTKSQITITLASGDRASNVQRWNGQVQGSPDQAAKALESSEKLTVNETAAEVFTLLGTGNSGKGIKVAIIPFDDRGSLFVKLMGNSTAVESQHADFIEFLKSLTW